MISRKKYAQIGLCVVMVIMIAFLDWYTLYMLFSDKKTAEPTGATDVAPTEYIPSVPDEPAIAVPDHIYIGNSEGHIDLTEDDALFTELFAKNENRFHGRSIFRRELEGSTDYQSGAFIKYVFDEDLTLTLDLGNSFFELKTREIVFPLEPETDQCFIVINERGSQIHLYKMLSDESLKDLICEIIELAKK